MVSKTIYNSNKSYLYKMKLNLTQWPLMRLVRLAVTLGCFYAYFVNGSEWFILVIGIIALLQTLFNTKCADGSCEVPQETSSHTK